MYLYSHPLFYGENEKEFSFRICSVLGIPTYDTLKDGIQQTNIKRSIAKMLRKHPFLINKIFSPLKFFIS